MSKKPNQIQFTSTPEDINLLEEAAKKYNLSKSGLIQKIVSSWLFANKLQITGSQND